MVVASASDDELADTAGGVDAAARILKREPSVRVQMAVRGRSGRRGVQRLREVPVRGRGGVGAGEVRLMPVREGALLDPRFAWRNFAWADPEPQPPTALHCPFSAIRCQLPRLQA